MSSKSSSGTPFAEAIVDRSCCYVGRLPSSRSDILGSDGPVVDVVVDELVLGVSAAECDLDSVFDFIILKPVGTQDFRDLVGRDTT